MKERPPTGAEPSASERKAKESAEIAEVVQAQEKIARRMLLELQRYPSALRQTDAFQLITKAGQLWRDEILTHRGVAKAAIDAWILANAIGKGEDR